MKTNKRYTIEDFNDNEEALIAYFLAVETKNNILIDGMAGTGKRALIDAIIRDKCSKVLSLECDALFDVEFFFKIPYIQTYGYNPYLKEFKDVEYNPELTYYLESVEAIIINRCYLLNAFHLEWINKKLQKIKGETKPFGGIQMIFVGDYRDIIPRYNNDQFSKYIYMFFEAACFQAMKPLYIQLRRNYFYSDTHTNLLQSVRQGDTLALPEINRECILQENQLNEDFLIIRQSDPFNPKKEYRLKDPYLFFQQIRRHGYPPGYFVGNGFEAATGSKVLLNRGKRSRHGLVREITFTRIEIEFGDGSSEVVLPEEWVMMSDYDIKDGEIYIRPDVSVYGFPLDQGYECNLDDVGVCSDKLFFTSGYLTCNGSLYSLLSKVNCLKKFACSIPLTAKDVFLFSKGKKFLLRMRSEENQKRLRSHLD